MGTISLVSVFLLILYLVGCNNTGVTPKEQNKDGKLTIYTTIYPLQYFTERVGGEFVKVESIVPPGSDAHSVEVTTKTMMKLAESEAFIHTGTGLEGFADSVTKAIDKENVLIVSASEGVEFIGAKELDSHEEEAEEEAHEKEAHEEEAHEEEAHEEEAHEEDSHAEGGHEEHVTDKDPHIWLDPNRSIILAENIKNALVELEPKHKTEFENNFSSLKNELLELDSEFKNMVDQSKIKTFIVSHSAYGYWENVYGLKQIGISGLSPTDEPSHKQLTTIIELVEKNNFKYIFFEPNLTNKVAETVQNETNTESLTLSNLESLSEENIKNNEDYFDIMRKNLDALKKALN